MKQHTPWFLASFLKRYWKLLVVLLLIEAGRHVDYIVYAVGPFYFLVELVIGAIACALLLRNLFMRDSLDAYVQNKRDGSDSDFVRDWNAAEPRLKLILCMVTLLSFFLGACWIAASLAK